MKKSFEKIIEFKDHKIGLYGLEAFNKDWNNSEKHRGIPEKRCRIVKLNGEKVLQITLPKGTTSDGGSFWRLALPKGLTDVTFEYDIMFGKNFNFVRGGKLPGLSGGSSPGGGSKRKDGFSARLMWRAATSFEELLHLVKNSKLCSKSDVYKPYLVQYTYYPEKKTKKWGQDLVYTYKNKKIFLKPNTWFTIKMQVKLAGNPGNKDVLFAWVNGKRVLYKKLHLRNDSSYGVDEVMFSLFFGGNDLTWATKKNENVYFRRFEVKGA